MAEGIRETDQGSPERAQKSQPVVPGTNCLGVAARRGRRAVERASRAVERASRRAHRMGAAPGYGTRAVERAGTAAGQRARRTDCLGAATRSGAEIAFLGASNRSISPKNLPAPLA